ncbi:MAG: YlbL family protein [Actinomycetota bacterium]
MSRTKRFFSGFTAVLGLGLAFLAGWVQLPYFSLGPGPAREVQPLIRVSGEQEYPSQGKLIMTTVRFHSLSAFGMLVAWLDPHLAVVSKETLYPPGETAEQEAQRSLSQMDQSKIDATDLVLRRLTDYPSDHGNGALLEFVYPGCPAEGELFAGDVVESIDGTRVHSADDASKALDAVPLDEPIAFEVRAGGETHEITITRERCLPDVEEPRIGINLIDAFPFGVRISSGDVGGPSAGLMWALGLFDLLTPGDMTAGLTIGGTGTIDTRGRVGPIGGIEDKVVAAQRAGATVFLVPADNMQELIDVDTGDMELISVSTFQEALNALERLGGEGLGSGSTGA